MQDEVMRRTPRPIQPTQPEIARELRKQQAFKLAEAALQGLIARERPDTKINAERLTDDVVLIARMQLDKLIKANII